MNKQDLKTNINKGKSKNKNRIKTLMKSDTRRWEFTPQRNCERVHPYTGQCDGEEGPALKTQVTQRWGVRWGAASTTAMIDCHCESWEMESGILSQEKKFKKEQKIGKEKKIIGLVKNRKYKKGKKRRKKSKM